MPPELLAATTHLEGVMPVFCVEKLSDDMQRRARATTWRPGCPVALDDLRAVTVSHWDFTATPATGVLIVHEAVAGEVVAIFERLFRHGFLIERVRPVEDFGGDDLLSMENNNTSAFNCREAIGFPGQLSRHSWGTAIDINPLYNPYVAGTIVMPDRGRLYLDRSRAYPGVVLGGSFIVRVFESMGWTWAGAGALTDYQHFQKIL